MIDGVKPNQLIAQFGIDFKQDLKTKVANYGSKQADALEIMLSAKWK
jgi:iron(III) transport system substrate-binding protein